MPKKIAKTKARIEPVEDWKILFLKTGEDPEPYGLDSWLFCTDPKQQQQRQAWNDHRQGILSAWIKTMPGTRPWAWWQFEAPRDPEYMNGTFWENTFPIKRSRIGGTGISMSDRYPCWLEALIFGIPKTWSSLDPEDPPTFESQASYLKRHDLLTKTEIKLLKPSDYEPESILSIIKYEKND